MGCLNRGHSYKCVLRHPILVFVVLYFFGFGKLLVSLSV